MLKKSSRHHTIYMCLLLLSQQRRTANVADFKVYQKHSFFSAYFEIVESFNFSERAFFSLCFLSARRESKSINPIIFRHFFAHIKKVDAVFFSSEFHVGRGSQLKIESKVLQTALARSRVSEGNSLNKFQYTNSKWPDIEPYISMEFVIDSSLSLISKGFRKWGFFVRHCTSKVFIKPTTTTRSTVIYTLCCENLIIWSERMWAEK